MEIWVNLSTYPSSMTSNITKFLIVITMFPFYFALMFYLRLISFKLCVTCFRTFSFFLDAFAAWTNKKSDPLNILSGRFTASQGALFKTYNSSGKSFLSNHGNWNQTWLNSKEIANIVPAYCLVTIYFEVIIWIFSFLHHITDPNDSFRSKYHFYSVKNINSPSPWICNSSR